MEIPARHWWQMAVLLTGERGEVNPECGVPMLRTCNAKWSLSLFTWHMEACFT
jgi:hypothetical protein